MWTQNNFFLCVCGMQSSRIECILLFFECRTLDAILSHLSLIHSFIQSIQKMHNSSTESFASNSTQLSSTFFVNDDRFFPRCCCSFFNFYVLLCCFALYISLLHIFLSVYVSVSLCIGFVHVCVVGWLRCVAVFVCIYFEILLFCVFYFFPLLFDGFETSFWCMLFFFRLYAIYSERGCICLCYAFNLYLRSLSMRCYARLSLFVVHSVSVVGLFYALCFV